MSTAEQSTALVTGAAGDIGRATSAALASMGYAVVMTDIVDAEAGAAAVRDVVDLGHLTEPPTYRHLDTTSASQCEEVISALPRLDVVVANAGMVKAQPFLEIEFATWSRHLEVNLSGAFAITQAGARRMVSDGVTGSLIYVSSWVATRPWPEIAAYSSSKAGIDQLMRQAALELSPYGIRANSIAPGIVTAGMARHQLETEPAYAARAATAVPLGELQTAEQIAAAIAFLASPAASTMTGSVLLIDGGCSLGTM